MPPSTTGSTPEPPRRIRKLLIANRGEIAVRVIRTCRELGIRTVAVFSDVDRTAPHVLHADEAVEIGPAPSSESYLRGERIIDVALTRGCQAIHPGYGFLSENADFAQLCEDAGLIFVGPPPAAIRAMGDKTAARTLMEKAGVPLAPGTVDAIEDPGEARDIAVGIGFPVLIKAAAGGGGKGMRIVRAESEFLSSMEAARREAQNAFGDGRVFIEKYIERPKHIEFQLLADSHGSIIHLFERDCSIQRRHQKVIEEAPAPTMTEALREQMAEAAISVARSCDYLGAGTVEFLVDSDGSFYFMEMNTRLQVEHPVTEGITGIDLVAEQIRIAEGHPMSVTQEQVAINGHAIECRVYAENVPAGFLPDPGPILGHRPPSGLGVRVDAGVEEGGDVLIHYDPMISKLTVWGRSRQEAVQRMIRAIDEYEIAGVETTLPFCRFVMSHEAFAGGAYSTHFVDQHFSAEKLGKPADELLMAALAARMAKSGGSVQPTAAAPSSEPSRWVKRRA